jgi:hypothetical protein
MFDSIDTIDRLSVVYRYREIQLETDWPTRGRRGDLTVNLRITLLTEDPPRLALSTSRINLYSSSAKTSIAALLRKTTQIEPATADDLIHHLAEHTVQLYRQDGQTTRPIPQQRTGDTHLIWPIWPNTGGTLVGAGTNSFKSLLALAIAVQASLGVEVLEGNTRPPTEPKPILYCDWESDEASFAERLYAICRGHGLELQPAVAYKRLTQPFPDVAAQIRDEIRLHGYHGSVLDSLSAAVGGSLVDDELANQFWNSVAAIEVPTLILAHKSQEAIRRNHQRVFGSVMHENRSRMLWDAYRETDSNLVRWEVVSDNNTGRKGQKLAWRVNIANEGEDHERRLDSITIAAVNPNDVREAPDGDAPLKTRITRTITENGPLTHQEIALLIAAKPDSIKAILNRNKSDFYKTGDSKWHTA